METEVINTQVNETENVNELETLRSECETLKAENAGLSKMYEGEKKSSLRNYREARMLKDVINLLMESGKVTKEEVMMKVLESNALDLEDLLYTLAR